MVGNSRATVGFGPGRLDAEREEGRGVPRALSEPLREQGVFATV